jgi:outer membrane protein TolC
MKHLKIKFLAIFCLPAVLSFAQNNAQEAPRYELSLNQAIELARKNNENYKNALLEKDLAKQSVNEVLSTGLPQINGQVQAVHNPVVATLALPDFISPAVYGNLVAYGLIDPRNPNTPPPPARILPAQFGVKNSLTASVSASWLLFDGGYLMGLKASKEYVKLSSLSAKQAEIELELSVKKAYYSIMLLKASQAAINQNIVLLEKTANEINANLKVGFVEQIDADRIKLALSNVKIQAGKVEDQLNVAQQYLKLLLAVEPNATILLTDDLEKINPDALMPAMALNDFSERIEMKLLDQQKKLNAIDRKRWQYGYAPSLVAFGSYQRNSFGNTFGDLGNQWFEGSSIGATLSIPLFDGLRKSAMIQKTRINDLKIQNGKNLLQRSIEIERINARNAFLRAKQTYDLQAENEKLARDLYNRANIRYREGLGSSLEITGAQTDLLNAQNNKLAALYDLLVAEAEFIKASGK